MRTNRLNFAKPLKARRRYALTRRQRNTFHHAARASSPFRQGVKNALDHQRMRNRHRSFRNRNLQNINTTLHVERSARNAHFCCAGGHYKGTAFFTRHVELSIARMEGRPSDCLQKHDIDL